MKKAFKVDFMIVGAQKSGTTTLAKMLSSHPSIVCCSKKEPMFFSSADKWERELAYYHSLFQWKEGALHFEASTSYTCYPHHNLKIWDDLYAYNPDLKIIYIVRHPIDRIVSSYMHSYKRGYIDQVDIEEAIIKEPILLDMTRYATQIRPYIQRFGSNQLNILFFEDLVSDRNKTLSQLSDFLGISIDGFPETQNIHANKSLQNYKIHHKYDKPGPVLNRVQRYLPPLWKIITDNSNRSFKKKPQLSPTCQEMILNLLEKEIAELEEITGRNLNSWREIKAVEPLSRPQEYHLTWYEAKMELFKRITDKLK